MNAISPISFDHLRSSVPALFATDKHSSRSEKYTYIPTIDAVSALVDKGFVVTEAKQARTRKADRKAFTKHLIRLRAPGIDTGTAAAPEVVLTNAHDGGSSFKAMAGLIVFACENGLVVADGRVESIRIPHRGDVLQDVVTGVQHMMTQSIKTAGVVKEWRGVHMSPDMIRLFTEQAHELRWGRGTDGKLIGQVKPEDLAQVRRDEDGDDNLWNVFNRVQENVLTGGVSYTRSSRRADGTQYFRNMATRPVRGISENVSLNQGLWALAEGFAAA